MAAKVPQIDTDSASNIATPVPGGSHASSIFLRHPALGGGALYGRRYSLPRLFRPGEEAAAVPFYMTTMHSQPGHHVYSNPDLSSLTTAVQGLNLRSPSELGASGTTTFDVPETPVLTSPMSRADIDRILRHPKSGDLQDGSYCQQDVLYYAQLAEYPYICANLPCSCRLKRGLAAVAANEAGLNFDPETGLISSAAGLTCYIVDDGEEYCLIFGGTSSGGACGGVLERSLGNLGTTSSQWLRNLDNALGTQIPDIYQQAVMVLDSVMTRAAAKGRTVATAGHSLGGGLAAFSAAALGSPLKPIKARAFCSAQIGHEARRLLAENCRAVIDAERLVSNVKHVVLAGDLVHQMDPIFTGVGAFGTQYEITPCSQSASGLWSRMSHALQHNPAALHKDFVLYIKAYYQTHSEDEAS